MFLMADSESSTQTEASAPAKHPVWTRVPAWVWPVLLAALTALQRSYAAVHTFWLAHDPGTVALMALHILRDGEAPLFLSTLR